MGMSFLDYQLTHYNNHMHIRENHSNQRWLIMTDKNSAPDILLEEEIHSLRCMLERMVIEGRAMTSDAVIELSTLLDSKINEYMKNEEKSR
jgi:hypothetical protein